MPNLQENPTLKDFQKYIEEMVRERGFTDETIPELFMLFLEECGEMAKAARKLEKVKSDPNSKEHLLEEEIADVFIYLLDICNKFNIDLEKAFREKEKINKKRTWK
ncbi:RS21-C6 protein [bacterium]|nr:RS21-C6 protein [bacterium]|tara:strand:- start:513 stop:830 length:318 start_codon:yes stop_codon:yes gene_type:complete